jgi:hypothetical protein
VREWLFEADDRFLMIVGSPGTGKTSMAAWLAGEGAEPADPDASRGLGEVRNAWAAAHFCSRRFHGASIDPRSFTRNMASQLSLAFPQDYVDAVRSSGLIAITSNLSVAHNEGSATGVHIENLWLGSVPVREAFDHVVRVPLEHLAASAARPVALLVDGLDEALGADQVTIADLIASLAESLGDLKVLVTTKPDRRVLGLFPGARIVDLDSGQHQAFNVADLAEYVTDALGGTHPAASRGLASAANGNFMYARHMVRSAAAGLLPDRQEFPQDLSQLYSDYLGRLLPASNGDGGRSAADYISFLGLLSVAFEPLSINAISGVLGITQARVNQLIDELQQVIVVAGERSIRVQFFHSSMSDFVANQPRVGLATNPYYAPAAEQHARVVSSYSRRFGPFDSAGWVKCDSYGLQYLPSHMIAVMDGGDGSVEMQDLFKLILNPAFVKEQLRRKMDDAAVRAATAAIDVAIRAGDRDAVLALVREYATSNEIILNGLATTALVDWYKASPGPEIRTFLSHASPQARRVALNAAYRIGLGTGLIAEFACDKNDELQQTVAYMANLEWESGSKDAVMRFIDRIADGIRLARPMDGYRRVRFIMHCFVFIYTNHPNDLVFIRWGDRLFYRLFVTRLRVAALVAAAPIRWLISLLAGRVVSGRIAEAALSTGAQEPRAFFESGPESQVLLRKAAALLDPSTDWIASFPDLIDIFGSDVVAVRGYGGVASCASFLWSRDAERAAEMLRGEYDRLTPRARLWFLLSFTILFEGAGGLTPLISWQTKYLLDHDRDIILSRDSGQLRGFNVFLLPLGLACGRDGVPLAEAASWLPEALSTGDRELVAALTEALGIVGFYHPQQALPLLGIVCGRPDPALDDVLVGALSTIAVLHPGEIDVLLRNTGRLGLRGDVLARSDVAAARQLFDKVAFFSNAVNQTLRYPLMREGLVRGTIIHLADAKSPQDFARGVTRTALQMLHDSRYHLGAWAGVDVADEA